MKYKLIGMVISVFIFSACSDSSTNVTENDKSSRAFYFNSFESFEDTTGWHGLTKDTFANESMADSGKFSIHLGGGCIQPAASIEFDSPGEGKYKFSFLAKMGQPSQQAHLILRSDAYYDEKDQLNVEVNTTEWKLYQSEGYLYVPAGKKIILEIMVGGIVFADVYVDNLKIEKEGSPLIVGDVYKSVLNLFK